MREEQKTQLRLEIAHVLFMDIVGYSKLLIDEQAEALQELNELVRKTDAVCAAEAAGQLIFLPTGDGMALVFTGSVEEPVECAIQISGALREGANLPVRMGIHSGPVHHVADVNQRANIAGAGINLAQRVMDCGDAGHILLSKRVADDLAQYRRWQSYLHDIGEVEVKHGHKIGIVNFYNDGVGNPVWNKRRAAFAARSTASTQTRWKTAAIIAALVLVASAAAFFFLRQKNPASVDTVREAGKRIAVLPFKPLLPENRDQVLELGMADSLIAKLSNTHAIVVSSINAVRRFGGLEQDAVAAGKELRVDSVLDGSVQRAGDRIRVSARLINVADGTSLWSGTFDEKFTDVFGVQDAISQKVADALAVPLTGEEKGRLTRRYTDNVQAYQLYMTGRYHWSKLTPPDIRQAMAFFQQAIDLDRTYALAYFGLAEANRSLAINADVAAKDCLPQAKAAAQRALELDEALPEAHASLSFCLVWYDWQWAEGEKEARRAVALNPNSAHAHFACAHVLSDLGRSDEALHEIAEARRLDPLFMLYRALEGMFLLHAGETEEALERLQEAVAQEPNFWVTHLMLGRVYIQQRRYAEALTELNKAKELSHGNSEAIGSIGYAAAMKGDQARLRATVAELNQLGTQHYIPPFNIALVRLGVGDRDQALALLERAIEEHDVRVTLLKVDPRWDTLRSDPRFNAILQRIGLQ